MIKIDNDTAKELLKILRDRESQQMARNIIAERRGKPMEERINRLTKTRLLIQKLT